MQKGLYLVGTVAVNTVAFQIKRHNFPTGRLGMSIINSSPQARGQGGSE